MTTGTRPDMRLESPDGRAAPPAPGPDTSTKTNVLMVPKSAAKAIFSVSKRKVDNVELRPNKRGAGDADGDSRA
jgi:hypothetical protein